MAEWRYLAQNIVTREWVDMDLELRDVEIIDELSGPGGIMGSIAPEVLSATVNGQRILKEWQTAIYAEDKAGEIRGAGLLVRSSAEDDTQRWQIECPGWSAYPTGMVYDGAISWWDADPFDAVREIWAHLQSFASGDLGLQVTDLKSAARLSPIQPPDRPADLADAEDVKAPLKGNKPNKGKQPKRKSGESDSAYDTRLVAWDQAYEVVVAAWEDDYQQRKIAYDVAKDLRDFQEDQNTAEQGVWDDTYGDLKPYELSWWEAPDCGSEIDSLATQTPFDYRERHAWNADRTDVEHFLDLGQPTLGRRRQDLRFAVGENVIVIPPPEFDGDDFANEVIALGKGDGQAMLRSELSQRDDRLRRSKVLSAKDVGDLNRLRALADAELRFARTLGSIGELVILDHLNAPLGSFATGDEIFVQAGGDGWFSTDMWVRILECRLRPDEDSRMTLSVVASERA